MFKTSHAAILGVCFILGLTTSAYLLSQTMLNARIGVNTASVKGLAERKVAADELRWNVSFWGAQTINVVNGLSETEIDRNFIFAEAGRNKEAVVTALKSAGYTDAEISVTPVTFEVTESQDMQGHVISNTATMMGTVSVHAMRFENVGAAQDSLSQAIVAGGSIQPETPRYLFNKLNEIKPLMLQEATQNARIAADEFAKNANVTVGGIQDASQGGFSIVDLTSEETDFQDIEKIVRVVVNATFYLEN